jgi:hypothetical protein
MEYNFKLFADYFQLVLEDDTDIIRDSSNLWNDNHLDLLLVVREGEILIGTFRNMTVPLKVLILESRPEIDLTSWDKINECSISIRSGRLLVMGGTDNSNEAAAIKVQPGIYRVMIHYAGEDTISEDGLKGEDYYVAKLWPDKEIRETIKIK